MKSLFSVGLMAAALHAGALAQNIEPADSNLKTQAGQAPVLKVDDCGTPVKSTRLGNTYLVPNPDGKSHDALQIYFKQYGGPNTVVLMDLGAGRLQQVQTERGYNFHLAPPVIAPNGKLFLSILDTRLRQQVCIYDPASDELTLNALKLPEDLLGETHPMVLGTDGKIYCSGGHPTKAATAIQIDPDTGQVTSYGPIGPSHAPNDCWAYSMGADDRFIYIASGKVPWYLVAYDRETGGCETLLTTERVDGYISVSQGANGCTAKATGLAGTKNKDAFEYWLHKGKAVRQQSANETPPWPERAKPASTSAPSKPEISTAAATPDVNGNATFWYRRPQDKPSTPATASPSDDATLEAQGWRSFRYTVPIYPMTIYRLVELPDGRLFGTAGNYEGHFLHDPKTGHNEHPGKSGLSHYATAIHEGKLYLSGYPSAPVYVYDPARPWTAGTPLGGTRVMADDDPRSNPRRLAYLKESRAHKMYSAAVANGKIYFGGRWYRNGSAGGLGWWNPKTETAGGFWEPFSNYQINFVCAAAEGRWLVISAHRVEDTVLGKPKPEQGALFFLDTRTDQLVGEKVEPVARAKGPGPVVCVGGSRVIGWTENPEDAETSILYAVDAAERKVLFRRALPFKLPISIGSNQTERWDFRLGPDGWIWTFVQDQVLVRINPHDASMVIVGKTGTGGQLAFSGTDLYLGGMENLRCIRKVITAR